VEYRFAVFESAVFVKAAFFSDYACFLKGARNTFGAVCIRAEGDYPAAELFISLKNIGAWICGIAAPKETAGVEIKSFIVIYR